MKNKAALVLICVLLGTLFGSPAMAEAETTSVKNGTITVSTQTGVNRYIDNENVRTMILKTGRSNTITIPNGEGTKDKKLIIEAPNATIKNKADLDEIVVNDSRKYVEYASGNSIVVNDNDANIVLYRKSAVGELTVNSDTAVITVQKSAKAESIVCTAENADITIDTSSKSRLKVTVPEGVEPLIEGSYASKVKVSENPAEGTESGKKDETGKEDGTGKADETGTGDGTGKADGTGKEDGTGKADGTAKGNETGQPESGKTSETGDTAPGGNRVPDTSVPVNEYTPAGPSFEPAYPIEGINTCIYSTFEFAAAAESQEELFLVLNDYRIDNPLNFNVLTPVSAKKVITMNECVIKGYDADGNLIRKVSILGDNDKMGIGDSRDDFFYDINRTLRIKKEYNPCYSSNEDGSNRQITIIIYEVDFDENGKKTYDCTHNPRYIITRFYDENGKYNSDVRERVNGAF